jgi:hypothetical protein
MARVTWRGVTLDERTAAMMQEVADNTPKDLYVQPTQGSYNTSVSASAGTHAGGGAIDLAAKNLTSKQRNILVREMRRVGFAAWLRTPAQSNWPYHVHAIAMGCKDASDGAKAQMVAYRQNRNGLASGGPDDGPRQFVDVTWESYKAGGVTIPNDKQEGDMAISKADADLIAKRIWLSDIITSPAGKEASNPTWKAGSYMREFALVLRSIDERLARLEGRE